VAQVMMKRQNQMIRPRRPGVGSVVVVRRVTPRRFAIGGIAACAVVIHCLASARAADVLSAEDTASLATQAQQQAYSPQAYQMKRYQAFARQAEMPVITATDKTTIEVGRPVKIDINRLAQLSSADKEALASQFGVPAEVIGGLLERTASNPPPSAVQFAQDIRTAVVDYRFLQGEWGRYNPPAEGKQIKAAALLALQTGDLSKAWQLYDGLQKPQPPSLPPPAPPANLRVISQQ
jgi:hypothetical protein